jgi:cbb3-type cytochrome c oxidase subunit III
LLRKLSAAAGGVAVVLVLAACGTGGLPSAGNPQNGQKLFTEKCGGCHSLSAAGTTGQIGPNLDDSFAQARADGYKESAIAAIVHDQIKFPGQYPVATNNPDFLQANMPANLVTGQDADDVAAYVAANAGCRPGSPSGTCVPAFAEAQVISEKNGKDIFKKACSSCHTLKDAGTTGTIGPNLDQLKPAFPIVVRQVTNGGVQMPAFKDRLSKAQIDAVARYVATHAGK